jgi:hypothetical protein
MPGCVSGLCGVLIGPEGGFTAAELDSLAQHSFVHFVSLGGNVLRAETAAAAAVSILSDKLSDLFAKDSINEGSNRNYGSNNSVSNCSNASYNVCSSSSDSSTYVDVDNARITNTIQSVNESTVPETSEVYTFDNRTQEDKEDSSNTTNELVHKQPAERAYKLSFKRFGRKGHLT